MMLPPSRMASPIHGAAMPMLVSEVKNTGAMMLANATEYWNAARYRPREATGETADASAAEIGPCMISAAV